MPGSLIPAAKQRFFTAAGAPLVGGLVTTYAAGTSSKKVTYQDRALTAANTNPIVLDARGEAVMFGAGIYRINVTTAGGVPIYDLDNVECYAGILDVIQADIADVEAARAAAITQIESIANNFGLVKFFDIIPAGNVFYAYYGNGQVQRIAPTAAGMMLWAYGWPVAGFYGEIMLEIVNGGAYGFDVGSGINWVKADGSTTTSFAASGYTLQAAGTDWIILWTRNGGSKVWGKVMR